MTGCAACGRELAETSGCPACYDPDRYDDHVCDGLCDECWAVQDAVGHTPGPQSAGAPWT